MSMRNPDTVTPENMNGRLPLEIGGLRILLKSHRTIGNEGKVEPEDDPDQITFHVRQGHIPEIRNKSKVFDSRSAWSLFTSGDRYFLQDDNLSSHLQPETLIRFARNFEGGDIYLRNSVSDKSIYADLFGHPLNQILLILLLSSRGGILVHACGIDDSGRGYLFLGNSSHGKSTLAKLWHANGATVLNDDRIIVREREGAFWMYGTPWHGTFAETSLKSIPVKKIFFLKHGKENLLLPKTGTQAVSMLLTRSFPPFWDIKGMEQALKLMAGLTGSIPCFELHFLPDGEVVDFIRRLHQ
jgi:hypothetical protein